MCFSHNVTFFQVTFFEPGLRSTHYAHRHPTTPTPHLKGFLLCALTSEYEEYDADARHSESRSESKGLIYATNIYPTPITSSLVCLFIQLYFICSMYVGAAWNGGGVVV